jgi:hypothetical protein
MILQGDKVVIDLEKEGLIPCSEVFKTERGEAVYVKISKTDEPFLLEVAVSLSAVPDVPKEI